jgi:hypothetical protein
MNPVGVEAMCLAITLIASQVIAPTVGARNLEQLLEQYKEQVSATNSADWNNLLYVSTVDGGRRRP